MVSIPDWSKLGRLVNQPREPSQTVHSKYFKQKEEEAIRQAEEQGYFIDVNKQFIKLHFLGITPEEEDEAKRKSYFQVVKKADFRKVRIVKLIGLHVRTLSDIGVCSKLRICVLHTNYIKDFQPLSACSHLIKLDLHNNQISMLPGAIFWSTMRSLRVLNLHNNPIGKIDNLHFLAACPSLMALTLYDTPLSLKRNYRHHVVNTIWSLKALDKYVISDEEIIEDAEFGGKFGSLHPSFSINLCPASQEDASYEEEKAQVRYLMSRINGIMAHHSPVLIVQRYVRGWLVRRKYKAIQDTRIWAAVTIQREYRQYKGVEGPVKPTPLPPSSPMLPNTMPTVEQADAAGMDYDTYIRNRRPGSTTASEMSASSKVSKVSRISKVSRTSKASKAVSDAKSKSQLVAYSVPEAPANSADERHAGERRRKNLFINLAKLQNGTLVSLHDEAITVETVFPPDATTTIRSSEKRRKKKEVQKKQIKSVRQFFGPVVDTLPSHESKMTDNEEIPVTQFRLQGLKETVQLYDPVTDMVLSRKQAGDDVRAAEINYHQNVALMPKPKVQRKKYTNTDQRLFSRVQGTMGLSCLNAVQQAYKDREKAEKQMGKVEYVLGLRDQKEAAKERIKLYHAERRNQTLQEREQEQKFLIDTLEHQELHRLTYIDKTHEVRVKTAQHQRRRKAEGNFISDFNAQNTSVANALLRHDRQAKKEDKTTEQAGYIQAQKFIVKEQQDIVKKYLEHRTLMRQTESALNRAALDSRMLQEANDRLMAAKARVAQQKARSATVHTFYPLPSTAPLPPVADSAAEVTVERWDNSPGAAPDAVSQPTAVAT